MQSLSDTELLDAYVAGENMPQGDTCGKTPGEAAFGELMRRHGALVYRACHRLLKDAHEAEDASQAVFVVLARKAGKLRKGDLSAWLYRVAHHVAAETVRRRMRRTGREDAYAATEAIQAGEFTSPDAAESDVLGLLDTALMSLPERYRQAVILRYLQNHSEKDAAQLASVPLGTLSGRASQGIAMLRQRLSKRGVALSGMALAGLLTSEASASVPETLLPSILATVKTAVATTATATTASSIAAMLAKGAMKAMFWNSVKTAAMVAMRVGVVGVGGVAAVQAVAEKAPPSKPATSATTLAQFNGPVAATFSSKAWENEDASRDLARAGIRVFHLGGWFIGANAGWATPAELRRRMMPPRDYVEAWAASRERDVLWLGSNSVAIIGNKAELENLKKRAGGDAASTEDILSKLEPIDGRPVIEPEPQPDLDALQKEFRQTANEDMKLRAAAALCAAGNDEGLAFLKTKLEKNVPSSNTEAAFFYEPLGAHGGPEAMRILKAALLDGRNQQAWRAGLALGRNGGSEALTVLREALRKGKPEIAYAAACGLELIGGKEGLELGLLALAHADPKVRRAGVFGLWRAHGEQALPSLEQALADEDTEVRGRAVVGLGNLSGDKARDLIRLQLTKEKDAGVLKKLKDAEAQMKK